MTQNMNIPSILTQLPAIKFLIQEKSIGDAEPCSTISASLLASYYSKMNLSLQSLLGRRSEGVLDTITAVVSFCLRIYIANNFTGILSPEEHNELMQGAPELMWGSASPSEQSLLRQLLFSSGEPSSTCVQVPSFLILCLALIQARDVDGSLYIPIGNIWVLRVHMIHQRSLQRHAHDIYQSVMSSIQALKHLLNTSPSVLVCTSQEPSTPQIWLEVGLAEDFYHLRDEAMTSFRKAMGCTKLCLSERSVMGVRTRYQTIPYVQHLLEAQSNPATLQATPQGYEDSFLEDQPVVCHSEKEGHDLFDRPQETTTSGPFPMAPLGYIDKAIILALCGHIKNTNPDHGITKHHIQIYLERLIADTTPAPFVLCSFLLLLRARIEHGRTRVQERSFFQLQELIQQYSHPSDSTPSIIPSPLKCYFSRTQPNLFFIVPYPPIWELKSEFGAMCLEENLFKTALAMFEEVLDWPNIIECCKRLDYRRKAANLAEQLLRDDPENPLLWVALGEATREVRHLWHAWELSHHAIASPMRALAKIALEDEQYEKVVEYFDQAVRINPMFGGDWFALGYAAMRLRLVDRSAEAFSRVCQINPEDAFAWNNLSSILLKKGLIRPAFHAMNQALRNNRRSWRMWANYFSIAVDLREIPEALHAFRIILEIGKTEVTFDLSTIQLFGSRCADHIQQKNALAPHDGTTFVESTEFGTEVSRTVGSYKPFHAENDIATSALPHSENQVESDEEDFEENYHLLQPLMSELDLDRSEENNTTGLESACPSSDKQMTSALVEEGILSRFVERTKDCLRLLFSLFVSNADLYALGAVIVNSIEGPLAASFYRIRELRCTMQVDQWERVPELFVRVCEALQDLFINIDDAIQQFLLEGAEKENATFSKVSKMSPTFLLPTISLDKDADVEQNIPIVKTEDPKEIFLSIQEKYRLLLNNVNAVVTEAAPFLNNENSYNNLILLQKEILEKESFFQTYKVNH